MISHRLSGLYGVLGAICLILSCTFVSAEDRNDWQQPDRVMSDLGMKPGTRVADIGCGEGYFTLRLARAVGPQGLVFAVDINARALAALKKQADQQLLTNVTVVVSESTVDSPGRLQVEQLSGSCGAGGEAGIPDNGRDSCTIRQGK